jgi:hypothetical protein
LRLGSSDINLENELRATQSARAQVASLRAAHRYRAWAFPAAVIATAIILTGLGWSGTSIGFTQPGNGHVIAGTPRPIRSDEWSVSAPLVVAQSHHGYPKTTPDSIGPHNLNVLLDVPTKTWPTLFRPWDYGYFFLGVARGYAFKWWMLSVVVLLGSYGLLFQLTRKPAASALFAVAIWASPFFAWWYLDLSLASAGMGMAALAAFLAALERPAGWRRAGFLAVSTWALISFILVLYPPFQIPVALTMVAIGLADAWFTSGDLRHLLRRLVVPVAAVLGTALVVVGAYYLSNRTAIRLINSSLYPGRRRAHGGVTNLYQFFSAPYGAEIAIRGYGIPPNQSEISSFVVVAPFVCLQLLRVGFKPLRPRARAQLAGSLAALTLLGTWYFLGLPAPLAAITGLDRVPPTRAIGGFGLAGVLFVAIFSTGLGWRRPGALSEHNTTTGRRDTRLIWGAACSAAVGFAATYWSGRMLNSLWPALGIGFGKALATGLAVGLAVFLLAAGRAVPGASVLAVIGLVSTLPVNPLYDGLAPYTSPSLTGVFTSVPGAQSAAWASFKAGPIADELIASGLTTINATSVYPNPEAWKILDPKGSHRNIWDRYANLVIGEKPGIQQAQLTLPHRDTVRIVLDPCGAQLRELGVRFIVTTSKESEPCLQLKRTADLLGVKIFIYYTKSISDRSQG